MDGSLSLQDITELLEATGDSDGSSGVQTRQSRRAHMVFVADANGRPLAVWPIHSRASLALAEATARCLAGDPLAEWAFCSRVPDYPEPLVALGIRFPADAARRIFAGVFRPEELASPPGGLSETATLVADAFVHVMGEKQADDHRLRTRIEHLLAEQETLRASHSAAISSAIEEREERLRQQEQHMSQLQAIMMMAADGIITINETGEIETFNEAASWIFGYSPNEVIGQKIAMLAPPPHQGLHQDYLLNHVCEDRRGRLGPAREIEGKRKDGTVFPLDLAVSEVTLDNRRIFTAIVRDITDRKRAEEELTRLHLQNEMILNSAGEGICGLDSAGNAIFVNPSAERMLGWKAEQLIGKSLHDMVHRSRSDGRAYPRGECPVCFTCRGTPRSLSNQEVFWRKDGSSFPVEYTSNPIREGDSVVGAVVTFRDITQRRMLEAQLRQAQKLESIGQLAAGIAHEINTPTQYIGDNGRFLQEAFDSLAPLLRKCLQLREAMAEGCLRKEIIEGVFTEVERADVEYLLDEVPKAIGQSLEGVERVATIVRSMKEFSHPGGEDKQAVDLNRAVNSTLTISRNEWKYVADIVTDFDADLPLVTCMPADCNQVFLNLIVNAAHAIADKVGDGSAGKGTITVRTRRLGDTAEIRVEDTGSGIPEHIRSRVFDPFFTTKEVGRGTGQGLAIAHSIVVEKHGGTITFDSRVGEGTAFIIRLPIQPGN